MDVYRYCFDSTHQFHVIVDDEDTNMIEHNVGIKQLIVLHLWNYPNYTQGFKVLKRNHRIHLIDAIRLTFSSTESGK